MAHVPATPAGPKGKGLPPTEEEKNFTFHIDLDGFDTPVHVQSNTYKQFPQIGIRQTFRGQYDGVLYFGKQGINIMVDDVPHVIMALLAAYNQRTNSALQLLDGDNKLDLDDLYQQVIDEMAKQHEPVRQWSKGS